MQHRIFIKKIAVLGAGVMGAQIAAHCVNAGIETLLFDLAAAGENKNNLVEQAIANLIRIKPTPLATPNTISYLQAKNYNDDLSELNACDLIIEAIAERFELKAQLYSKIFNHLHNQAILVTNTSGLSINALAEILPQHWRHRFCGMHFFNPPRYMHLVELIPSTMTDTALVNQLETWLTSYIGKGVVRAFDTPNFIANRIGVFSLLAINQHASLMGLSLDEVDILTGTLLGRPKSATFRTMDIVGLDTMQYVVQTMAQQLSQDPWHTYFQLPAWLNDMILHGHLGQKSGQGIYRKQDGVIEVFDVAISNWRAIKATVSDELKMILNNSDPTKRLQQLHASANKQARFLIAYYLDLFAYCAYHLAEIANSVKDIDLAMRWGFGWKKGPFEEWETAGVITIRKLIEEKFYQKSSLIAIKLPEWLHYIDSFYNENKSFSVRQKCYVLHSSLPIYDRNYIADYFVEKNKSYVNLFENQGLKASVLEDDIAVVYFKTKANTITQEILDGLEEVIYKAEQNCQGLVIYQRDATMFSAGANLNNIAKFIQTNQFKALEEMLLQFQHIMLRIKYSLIPTVAAVRGQVLGGGCELMMHCASIVAAFESYPGFVETSLGLIPAAGGCKEMALRAAKTACDTDLVTALYPYFHCIATNYVAGNAIEALEKNYFQLGDHWIMHHNQVLFAALSQIKNMQAMNYKPPVTTKFKIAGRHGYERIKAQFNIKMEDNAMSQYDYFIAKKLAYVMCGGNLKQNDEVDETWMLTLEREVFMSLVVESMTQKRILYWLETGKALRN